MENKISKKLVIKVICVVVILNVLAVLFAMIMLKNKNYSINYYDRLDSIMADDKEVERKWLIKKEDIPYNLNDNNVEVYDIQQTYICFDPEMRVRNYNNGQSYEFTIKTNMSYDALVRDETNINITKEQYDNLITKKEGVTIHKTRYQLYADNQVIAFDIFHGDLDGLAYMEFEFLNREESEAYKEPNWVIKDVTSDLNYKNGHLARFGIPQDAYK